MCNFSLGVFLCTVLRMLVFKFPGAEIYIGSSRVGFSVHVKDDLISVRASDDFLLCNKITTKVTLVSKNFCQNFQIRGYIKEISLFPEMLTIIFKEYLVLEEIIVYRKVFFYCVCLEQLHVTPSRYF